LNFEISPVDNTMRDKIRDKIDSRTKPVGALGKLEQLAEHIALIQQTTEPEITAPHLFVFAGDHGAAANGISAYPQEVTHQMVVNFLAGGAAINVFARQHNIELTIVDAGVNHDFEDAPGLVEEKVGKGTRNYLQEPAMTIDECRTAIQKGADIIKQYLASGSNCIGIGEMGIGNTSSASLIMHKVTGLPLEQCVGTGSGLDREGLSRKKELLQKAADLHDNLSSPVEILACFGGFEIAMMTGAFLQAASERKVILVDGFIATSALLIAHSMHKEVLDYCIFCHRSDENGHSSLLNILSAEPVLDLNMRLGEGTGAAVCVPILRSAVLFLNEMASFESANIKGKHA